MADPIRQPRDTSRITWSRDFAQRYNKMFEQAQKAVDSECIRYMAQYTPTRNTLLRKSATLGTTIGSGHIYYQSPYGRFQYYGKVMVSSVTGSAWARKEEKKVLTNPQTVDKTATEIKAAKKRKYNTVSAIQKNLRQCLEDLVYSLAFYNAMATQNYSFVCDFKDSILVDDETERTQDRQDVSMGAMPLWEYRMKWYGEDEKTAKLMTTDTTAEVLE